MENGLGFCMGDEEFYISQIEMFAESGKGAELTKFLANEDFDAYLISVHSLKSTAKTIGADKLSEEALLLENAIKEGKLEVVREGHPALNEHFNKLSEELLKGVKRYSDGGAHRMNIRESWLQQGFLHRFSLRLPILLIPGM